MFFIISTFSFKQATWKQRKRICPKKSLLLRRNWAKTNWGESQQVTSYHPERQLAIKISQPKTKKTKRLRTKQKTKVQMFYRLPEAKRNQSEEFRPLQAVQATPKLLRRVPLQSSFLLLNSTPAPCQGWFLLSPRRGSITATL